jgi:hypothetical protein
MPSNQTARRRARIVELDAMAEKMVGKLDAQDDGQPRGAVAPTAGSPERSPRLN